MMKPLVILQKHGSDSKQFYIIDPNLTFEEIVNDMKKILKMSPELEVDICSNDRQGTLFTKVEHFYDKDHIFVIPKKRYVAKRGMR